MSEQTQYIIRTEGMANSYGLGEVVSENVTLFRAGNYNLTAEELEVAIRKAKAHKVVTNGPV